MNVFDFVCNNSKAVLMRDFITENPNSKAKIIIAEMLTLLFYFLVRTGISLRKSGNIYYLFRKRYHCRSGMWWTFEMRRKIPLSGFGFLVHVPDSFSIDDFCVIGI